MAFSNFLWNGTAGTGSGANTSIDLTPSTSVAVGKRVLVQVITDNVSIVSGATTDHSISDTGGHTWEKVFEETETDGVAADGITVSLWMTTVTTEIPGTGSPITISFPSLSDSVATLVEFDSGDAPVAVDVAHDHGAASGAILSGLSSLEYLFWGVFGRENEESTATEDADYTDLVNTRSTGAGSPGGNVALHVGYRIATLTGDTYFPSDVGGGNKLISLAALHEGAVAVDLYVSVDDDPASPDDNDWVNNAVDVT